MSENIANITDLPVAKARFNRKFLVIAAAASAAVVVGVVLVKKLADSTDVEMTDTSDNA